MRIAPPPHNILHRYQVVLYLTRKSPVPSTPTAAPILGQSLANAHGCLLSTLRYMSIFFGGGPANEKTPAAVLFFSSWFLSSPLVLCPICPDITKVLVHLFCIRLLLYEDDGVVKKYLAC